MTGKILLIKKKINYFQEFMHMISYELKPSSSVA